MRALVTNDDGIGSEGIRHLALAAVGLGLDVVAAAPFRDSSGASASLIAVQEDDRIVVERRALDGLDGVPTYAVAAAPGFISLLAVRGAFGAPPDIVLSGINRGLNTGHAILHSGTVGAALTGSTLGRPGVAVSLETGWPQEAAVLHWETAAHVAALVVPWVLEGDDAIVLNVNAPNVEVAALKGLCRARLASFGAVQTNVSERGEGWVRVTVSDVDARYEPGTDAALIAERYATVTPLRPICEALDVDLPLPLP
ncbi:MAG: 5/3-nucleotidase [Actinomycetota bacterium]|nr:5/3-nucleotidase [Actinomycetota bacterium]